MEQRHGGNFHCPECGYECDRDVVGAIKSGGNTSRTHRWRRRTQVDTTDVMALSSSVPPRRECGHLMPDSAGVSCSSA
uniref:zinc ribbon domain-containing protein n=1 Tax=Halorientalis persicus TaxID=1367881 RepID=UPI003139027A